jgi:hypothetical protein
MSYISLYTYIASFTLGAFLKCPVTADGIEPPELYLLSTIYVIY